MQASKITMGIVGLGGIAQKAYLPILCAREGIHPVFCTRNTQVLKQLSTKYRVQSVYQEVRELIKSAPDAVMVHAATESHFEIVQSLLQAGIPTFVDKPLAYTLEEVERLLDLARQKNVLLYLGFNRRFLPILKDWKEEKPSHIVWEKNRVALPAAPRTFIFDDFIHVLDSLRFLSGGSMENLQVTGFKKDQLLERVYVQWHDEHCLVEAKMNRVSGITEEQVQWYSAGRKYALQSLDQGWVYQNETQQPIGYNPWDTTLYKRGFEPMIADWLQALQEDEPEHGRLEDIYQTHALCEQVLKAL